MFGDCTVVCKRPRIHVCFPFRSAPIPSPTDANGLLQHSTAKKNSTGGKAKTMAKTPRRTPRDSSGKKIRRGKKTPPSNASSHRTRRSVDTPGSADRSSFFSYDSDTSSFYTNDDYDDEEEEREDEEDDTLHMIGTELKEMATELKQKGPSVIMEWLNPGK